MTTSREIECREFDWFAFDRDGSFALFATGGCGVVPDSVRASVGSHDAISEAVEVTGWGSSAVWQSYARVGLYAYDWSDAEGRYVRVAEPTAPLSPALATRLAACPDLLELDLRFAQAAGIEWVEVGSPIALAELPAPRVGGEGHKSVAGAEASMSRLTIWFSIALVVLAAALVYVQSWPVDPMGPVGAAGPGRC
ncbi:hypothetical protein ASE35_14075 [Lysobacter sp. Root916]|uniref:hypothetical protein n=1 Tax=Lysobacter sp. Root916 TaxID=1736606 RepID=UPI00070CDB73|nr:hypothetical protein [Lysobacter sp. Root916]KRD32075.1 hypothetical protein ASE35_14075 [Lysobacter sp. Root916]